MLLRRELSVHKNPVSEHQHLFQAKIALNLDALAALPL